MSAIERRARKAPMICLVLVVSASVVGLAAGKKAQRGHQEHRFEDPFDYTAQWDHPDRDEWQNPLHIARTLDLDSGSHIADIGAGTGYLTRFLSWVAEEDGRVYAVDIEPKMFEYIRNRQDMPFSNIETILADPDDPKLPPDSVDAIIILNTWHHIPKRKRYIKELAAPLRRGGRVAIVDWREGELPIGPPPEMKLSRDEIVAEFESAGWTLTSETFGLEYQYLLIFRP